MLGSTVGHTVFTKSYLGHVRKKDKKHCCWGARVSKSVRICTLLRNTFKGRIHKWFKPILQKRARIIGTNVALQVPYSLIDIILVKTLLIFEVRATPL